MTKRLVFSISLLGAATPVLAQGGADAQRLRRELRAMENLLDQTVEQVSRPNAGFVLAGAPSSRGYLLRGQGVVFVLPPRRLPSPPLVVAHTNRGGIVVIRGTTNASDLVRVEAQVAEYQRDAQQQWYELERSFIELEAQLLMATGEAAPPVWGPRRQVPAASRETPVTLSGPESGAATGAAAGAPRPAAPVAPPPIEPPIATGAPESLGFPPEPSAFPIQPPAPPWSFWHDDLSEQAEARSPDRVVEDTRNALVQLLESHGHLLTSVSPDETISVVVDFVAGTPFLDDNARPARSLSLRVRKRDLDERRAGRIGPDELRRRVETSQY